MKNLPKEIKLYLQTRQAAVDEELKTNPQKKPSWNLSQLARTTITSLLMEKQRYTCAYCQDRINKGNMHIEHFVERHDNAHLIYEYSNFIMSCEGGRFKNVPEEDILDKITRVPSISCGHYKTKNHHKTEIDYTLLINPTKEAYANYFEYKEGYIMPKHGLTSKKQARAAYTIERLNLNSLRLVHERNKTLEALMVYLNKFKRDSTKKAQITKLLNKTNPIYPKYRDMLLDKLGAILSV